MITMLLELVANVDAANEMGTTTLHVAAERNDAEMAAFLLSKQAAVNATKANGWTALHFAALTRPRRRCAGASGERRLCGRPRRERKSPLVGCHHQRNPGAREAAANQAGLARSWDVNGETSLVDAASGGHVAASIRMNANVNVTDATASSPRGCREVAVLEATIDSLMSASHEPWTRVFTSQSSFKHVFAIQRDQGSCQLGPS